MKPSPVQAVESEVMTRAEVAAWLKLKPRQVERLGVPCLSLGRKTVRYLKADVQSWLEDQRPSPRLHTRKAS